MLKKFWSVNPEGNKPLEYLGVDERLVLKRILNQQVYRMWIEFIWLRI
jgi:hypothetical protein